MVAADLIKEFNLPDVVFPGYLICPEYDIRHQDGTEVVYKFICGQGSEMIDYKFQGRNIKALTATLLGRLKAEIIESNEKNENEETSTEESSSSPPPSSSSSSERLTKSIKLSVLQNEQLVQDVKVKEDFANNLPKENDIVLARVTRISPQRANVEILAVENRPVPKDSGVGSNGSGVVAAGGGSGAVTFSVSQASSDLGETFRGIIRSQDVRATERDSVKMIESYKPGDIVRAQVLSLGDGTNYYLTTAKNELGVVFARAANGAAGLMYAIDWQTMTYPTTGATERRKCAQPFE
ncbi:ZYRO0F15488p [Zygosaccharomyces rouxii]|uniref:ZYRO0F15488p n=1 Tax=Zygosaccharomyces rouxii (strain ATCC 2623 / CBS 732 / NBRC 1130 / NCYC 568 / NRRL Y-229) TaxID=559307 RepID=C5DYS9_ZYGRC|nr:uncharacterized protein ZYRO0F15488g [Zygosaccharomyces rouxii]KAH9199696.1 exosome component EXOSC1/CSL4-domain-containing protein [Zygosaccharomyces rouxii]CAR28940.1 ZYRO0F15488p [Zygosaccharomyces rouxii]